MALPSSIGCNTPSYIANSASTEEDELAPTLEFGNVYDLFKSIKTTVGDILIVTSRYTSEKAMAFSWLTRRTDVTVSDFEEIDAHREKMHRKFRLRRFEVEKKILVITIPTAEHEKLHRVLYGQFFIIKLHEQGLNFRWEMVEGTTLRARGHPGGDGGEADSSGRPLDPPGIWPTLVIEAGDSETLAELRKDMRWWFEASDHQVKIVLLAKLERVRQRIILEKWEEDRPAQRTGATTTRRFASLLTPTIRQEITITKIPGSDPISFIVTRGDLTLSFEQLFCRPPVTGETDIVITVGELEHYAHLVWHRM
jgi:hypothetical protein